MMYRLPDAVSNDTAIMHWAARNPHAEWGQEGAAELAHQELHKVARAHQAMLWLTRRDVVSVLACWSVNKHVGILTCMLLY